MLAKVVLPFVLALLAALGNALYVFGIRKSEPGSNPFLFTSAALCACLGLCLIAAWGFGIQGAGEFLRRNWAGWTLAGLGLFLIYLGFYLLYSRFGASYYTLYAVLSILTTSILVGLVLFKEQANLFDALSIAAAFLSIAFWGLSKA